MNLLPIQEKVLKIFKKTRLKNNFYWTGGTLLSSFYLHHRKSYDLDFFTKSDFGYKDLSDFFNLLKKEIKIKKIEEKKIFNRYEFFIHNKEEARVDFVKYDYKNIGERKKWKGIVIDSLDDIAANKGMAFFDRNDPKDLFDLYFILTKKKYSVKNILNLTKKKFGIEFAESSFWSESFKKSKELEKIKPLILVNDKNIARKIKDYFEKNAFYYIKEQLSE